MKTQRNQTGRQNHLIFRRPPGALLLHFILFSLLILPPACLITSCDRTEVTVPPPENQDIFVPVDSTRYTVYFNSLGPFPENPEDWRLDLFVYDADGVRELQYRSNLKGLPDSLSFKAPERMLTAVAIANSPLTINPNAVLRYDSIELLTYSFNDDNPSRPIMSGSCNIEPGSPCRIDLSPLMARVTLAEVYNTMKGYVRLEDPRIWLENRNSSAEVLRFAGFRPSELLQDREELKLPYDIGFFKQNPMATLYCYPNDAPESSVGNPATELVFACEINGETCNFKVKLPPVRRNSETFVDLTVNGKDSFESKCY